MAEVVVATLNVSFDSSTESATGNLKLEIDDREDGLNGGDTSFSPGDNPYFFLFKDQNIELLTSPPKTTAGGVAAASPSTGVKEIEENLSFSNSSSASLGYPPDSAIPQTWNDSEKRGMRWLGTAYEISKDGVVTPTTKLPEHVLDSENNPTSELKMNPSINVAGVLQCGYESTGSLYKLTVDKTTAELFKEVMVIAIGRAT